MIGFGMNVVIMCAAHRTPISRRHQPLSTCLRQLNIRSNDLSSPLRSSVSTLHHSAIMKRLLHPLHELQLDVSLHLSLFFCSISLSKEASQQRVKKWGFSLEEALKDPVGRELFLKFLESEFSSENLR